MKWWSILLASLSAASPVCAQEPVKWMCKFTSLSHYTGGTETDLKADKFRVTNDPFELTFLETGKQALVLGNAGAAEVGRFRTERGVLQFVETTPAGTLQVTAIDKFGNAAHSRNTASLDGSLMPSQAYGKCRKH